MYVNSKHTDTDKKGNQINLVDQKQIQKHIIIIILCYYLIISYR